uniref:Potassium channel protein n=1 Tax=Desulfobacca acetoxidans TaxID=60893 RepID=A0A7C3WQA5_9BACT
MTLRRVLSLGGILVVIVLLGSLGYVWLEGWSFFDSLYMTVITLTTVGYGDFHPTTPASRLYTMALILIGVGFMLYVITSLARVVVEGEIREVLGRRKLLKQIKKLRDHYIICGFGRIGEIIARQLKERGIPLVIVENNPDLIPSLEESGYYYILGDASKEEVLLEAGIERAKGLVAVVSSDANNVFITLTARSLNPNLFIVARGAEPGSQQKLLRAGADRVESPYELGGRKMAQTILRPNVTTFIDLAMKEEVDLSMEEVMVAPTSPLVGLALRDSGIRQKLNIIVVAIKRASGEMLFNPSPGTQIFAGDTLIALGMRQSLDELEKMAGS